MNFLLIIDPRGSWGQLTLPFWLAALLLLLVVGGVSVSLWRRDRWWRRASGELFCCASLAAAAGALARLVQVEAVVVGEFLSENGPIEFQVVAFRQGEILTESFTQPLENSPFQRVFREGTWGCRQGGNKLFPGSLAALLDFRLEGFLGVTVADGAGRSRGVVALLHRRPLWRMGRAEALLHMLAGRVALDQGLRLQKVEQRALLEAVEQVPVQVTVIGRDGMIAYVNTTFEQVSGYSRHEVVGWNLRLLLSGKISGEEYEQIWSTLGHGQIWSGELPTRHRSGRAIWEHATIVPMCDDRGAITRFFKVADDITERKCREQESRFPIYFDPQSGLPNRVLFCDRLELAIAHARRTGENIAVMNLDLLNFKATVATLGHEACDGLLLDISYRISHCLRAEDSVARCGSSFLLLLTNFRDLDNAGKVAKKVLDALQPPFRLGEHEVCLAAVVGIAVYPWDGHAPRQLLNHAGTAMLHAGNLGRNTFQYFTSKMTASSLVRLTLEARLRRALENAEFVVHYQPLVDLASGHIYGAESLVRWQHPEWGLILPDEFIAVAEETGMICAIGEMVLRTACFQAQAWRQAGLPLQQMAVNLSARQFQQPDLVERVERALTDSGLPGSALGIEITETAIMQDHQTATATLLRLKGLAVQIAVDDFGVGYSSLQYLKAFPLDMLKIDRSFVTDLVRSGDDRAIVGAVVTLGHRLGLRVLAEGVESASQWRILRKLGVDQGQGFLYGKPCSAEDFVTSCRWPGVNSSWMAS